MKSKRFNAIASVVNTAKKPKIIECTICDYQRGEAPLKKIQAIGQVKLKTFD